MANEQQQVKRPKGSSQGPLVIWHGMTLRQLWKLHKYGTLLSWNKALTTASLPFSGLYNSIMAGVENLVYGRRLQELKIEKTPLFVIGHWRSGTTLLHNLLAQDPQFNFPTMYQVVFPNHFLVTEKVTTKLTAALVPSSRPMDNLPAAWDIPQEEDIGMAILTLISPYMLMAQPDRDDLVRRFWDLKLLTPEEKAFWMEQYLLFLKKCSVRDPRRLVLKSPVNTLRIQILLEMFPDAKFVYIYRNPFNVFNSAVHLRRTMFPQNCLGNPHLNDVEDSIFWVQEHTYRTYQQDKSLIPEGHLHELRFEDLEQDPVGELEKIYTNLNMDGFDALKAIIEPQVPSLRKYKKNSFQYDRAKMDMVYDRLRFVFEQYGYPHPAEELESVAA